MSVRNNALSQQRKLQVAREFGFNTTAFLHDAHVPGQPRRIDVFTPSREKRFSTDAVLGATLYIFERLDPEDPALYGAGREPCKSGGGPSSGNHPAVSGCTLQTKVGPIHAQFDASRHVAVIEVPHDIHVHARETPADEVLAVQKRLLTSPDKDKMKASYPIVSLRQGLTFTMVDFTTCPALMDLLTAGDSAQPAMDAGWQVAAGDGDVQPSDFTGTVYFTQLQTDYAEEPYITRLHVRMIANGVEEAVTPTGCCALAAQLALQKGEKGSRHVYAIEQGVEMGRRSQLCVEVMLDSQGTRVARLVLSGRAAFTTEGRLL